MTTEEYVEKELEKPPANLLTAILLKLPLHSKPVFRGVDLTVEEVSLYKHAFRARETITEPFFVSTTKSKALARLSGSVLFIIIGRYGRYIAEFSRHQDEVEVLFDCGATFRVSKVNEYPNGTLEITMTEEKRND